MQIKKFFIKFLTLIGILFAIPVFAQNESNIPTKFVVPIPDGSININIGWTISNGLDGSEQYKAWDWFLQLLIFVQEFLLKVALPVVAVGVSIFVAYELFTAEGDESKMKRAWMTIVYWIIAIASILLSSLVINIISNINLS